MTEQKNDIDHTTKDTDDAEVRVTLREKAKLMGITYSPNISNELLRERINARLKEEPESKTEEPFEEDEQDEVPAVLDRVSPEVQAKRIVEGSLVQRHNPTGNRMTKVQRDQAEREKQWAEQLKLVRIRVTCHNPQKAQLKGEVFTVSNKFVGTVRKFVPFGEATDNGYHVPKIILTIMQERKFQHLGTKKLDKGGLSIVPDVRLVPEFAIEILPDLSESELAALARTQLIAANQ